MRCRHWTNSQAGLAGRAGTTTLECPIGIFSLEIMTKIDLHCVAKKYPLKLFAIFRQPLGIFMWNFTRLLPVHMHIKMQSGIWLSSVTAKLQIFVCDHLVIFAHSKISVQKRLHWNKQITLMNWRRQSDANIVNDKSVWFIHRQFLDAFSKAFIVDATTMSWQALQVIWDDQPQWTIARLVRKTSLSKCVYESWRWTLRVSANCLFCCSSHGGLFVSHYNWRGQCKNPTSWVICFLQ